MSRFADPQAIKTISIGACQCPGTPHLADEATFRWSLSGSALARIGRAEVQRRIVGDDPFVAYRQTVLETVVSWNLLAGSNGTAASVPITEATIAELDADTLKFLAETGDALISNEGSLPNVSGAPSAASPPESASRSRRRTRKPTT